MLSGSEDFKGYLIMLVLSLPIIFLSLSLHETAHGFMAYKFGDPTAKNLGRLTLNPLKHIDPIGFICMLLAGFGWAKPVPINSRNFRNPRRDIALTSVAGPVSNLLLAFVFVLIYRLAFDPLTKLIYSADMIAGKPGPMIAYYTYAFLVLAIQMNITLAVFNLLPIPPLDGSKILYMFLPPKIYFYCIHVASDHRSNFSPSYNNYGICYERNVIYRWIIIFSLRRIKWKLSPTALINLKVPLTYY